MTDTPRPAFVTGIGSVIAPVVVSIILSACGGPDGASPIEPGTAAREAMLDVRSRGCGPRVGFGTATMIDPTLALTAAHVVAGASTVSVIDERGEEHAARVVWLDPDLDIAALRVPTGVGVAVELQPTDADDSDIGAISVSRGAFDDRVITTLDVQIPRHVDVSTTDIYLEADVVRPGFEIMGEIEPGDSGTMVVTSAGAAGIVWSRSNTTAGRAWAVDVPDDFRRPAFRNALGGDVDTGHCLH